MRNAAFVKKFSWLLSPDCHLFYRALVLLASGTFTGVLSIVEIESPVVHYQASQVGSIPGSGRSPAEGNGKPLQYSCLENPMDRGAWRAIVHRVEKNQTWGKQLSTHAGSSLLDLAFTFPSNTHK